MLYQLAEPMGVSLTDDEKKDICRAAERILAELRRRDRSLLLLDNVSNPALLGPDVLMRLPAQGHIHVIATTRLGPAQVAGSPHDHTFVAVDELPEADALALIRAHQPNARFTNASDEAAARQLVALLAGFTLAVETAAIYLGRHPAAGAIADYVERLRGELFAASESAAADPTVAVRHKEKLLERTLAVTFESLGAEQLHVLTLAALLPPDQVALPWLRALASDASAAITTETGASTDARWKQPVDALLSLRLFQPGGDVRIVRVHRLVQHVIQAYRNAQNDARLIPLQQARMDRYVLSRAEKLIQTGLRNEQQWEIEPVEWYARLRLADSTATDWAVGIAYAISNPMRDLARYPQARKLLIEANHVCVGAFGNDNPSLSAGLSNLGLVEKELGNLPEARRLLLRAIEIGSKHFEPIHPQLAFCKSNLAGVERQLGNLPEAKRLYHEAVEITTEHFGPNHTSLATLSSNLGDVEQALGNLPEAKRLTLRAIEIESKHFEPDYPGLTVRYSNLAGVECQLGNLPEAERLYHQAIEITVKHFEPDHPTLATLFSNLGRVERELGKLPEAKSLNMRAIEIETKHFGPDHPNLVVRYSNLAGVELCLGNLPEAKQLYHRAIEITTKHFDPNHLDFAILYGMLAQLEWQTDELVAAREHAAKSLTIFRNRLPADHPHIARAEGILWAIENREATQGKLSVDVNSIINQLVAECKSQVKAGRWQEAANQYSLALDLLLVTAGWNDQKTIKVANKLIELQNELGNHAATEDLLRRVVVARERVLGKEHPDTLTSTNTLAALLRNRGEFAEAEPLFLQTLEARRRTLGEYHPDTLTSIGGLALLFQAKGDSVGAEALFQEEVQARVHLSRSTGKDDPLLADAVKDWIKAMRVLGTSDDAIRQRLVVVRQDLVETFLK